MPKQSGRGLWSGLALAATLAATLGFGWWPFNFLALNHIYWDTGNAAVRFDGAGLMRSRGPLIGFEAGGPVSVELWLRPDQEPDDSLPCVAGFYEPPRADQCLLGQWKDTLILRQCPLAGRDERTYREMGVGGVLKRGQTVLITLISSQEQGVVVYTNGVYAQANRGYHFFQDPQPFQPLLVLGASALGDSHWRGALKGVAVYARALEPSTVRDHRTAWQSGVVPAGLAEQRCLAWWRFASPPSESIANLAGPDNPLVASRRHRPLARSFLTPIWRDFIANRSYVTDVAVNFFGFMPLGAALRMWLEGRRAGRMKPGSGRTADSQAHAPLGLLAWAIALLVSLAIESGQVYLPTRDSQMSDWMFNAAGAWAGVVLGMRLLSRL